MEFNAEQLQKQFDILPKSLKDLLNSVDTSNAVETIGVENNLNSQQIIDLADEVGLVLLALRKPFDFASRVVTRLKISSDEARRISESIKLKIFEPVRKDLVDLAIKNSVPAQQTSKPEPISSTSPNAALDAVPIQIKNAEQKSEKNTTFIEYSVLNELSPAVDSNTTPNTKSTPTISPSNTPLNPPHQDTRKEPVIITERIKEPIPVIRTLKNDIKEEQLSSDKSIADQKLKGITATTQEKGSRNYSSDPYREPAD